MCSVGFLEEVQSVRQHVMQDSTASGNWPILVHCQAGAGRTGLFIMTDFLKTQLECNQVECCFICNAFPLNLQISINF
jgi:protein tyrosine phosphatase